MAPNGRGRVNDFTTHVCPILTNAQRNSALLLLVRHNGYPRDSPPRLDHRDVVARNAAVPTNRAHERSDRRHQQADQAGQETGLRIPQTEATTETANASTASDHGSEQEREHTVCPHNVEEPVNWFPRRPPSGEPTIEILHVGVPDHEQRYRYELTYEFTDALNRRWRPPRGPGLTLLTQACADDRVQLDRFAKECLNQLLWRRVRPKSARVVLVSC